MMLPSINMMSAAADSTAVKSDELQRSTTSISDTTPTDIEGIPSDTIPALSKRELRRQRVAKRNLHYNILGGPSYTPDFGLLVGGSALMTFRMNPSDTTQRRSVVPMAIALMFKGGLNLMTKPQLFFKGDRFRIFGTFSYKNTIENFYGIGYSTNKDYERGEDTSEYLVIHHSPKVEVGSAICICRNITCVIRQQETKSGTEIFVSVFCSSCRYI